MGIIRAIVVVLGLLWIVLSLVATITGRTLASRLLALIQAFILIGLTYFVWLG